MKKILYIFFIALIFSQTGCSEWLDVQPVGQTEEDKMFEDEAGFLRTLTGSYLLLSSRSAYGYELTVGFPEEIVHNWMKTSDFYVFNYQEQSVESRLYNTWNQLYMAIANLNLLLDNLKKKDEADFEYYNIIKGEALGLRAYLHLDLLRMFGPVLADGGMSRKAIPYHETFSNKLVELMTAQEVLDKIKSDLDEAYALLKDDVINTYGRKVTPPANTSHVSIMDDLAYDFRGVRMNYYAVCGTLARYCMFVGDKANAVKYAMEVIDAKATDGKEIFRLVNNVQDIVNNGDIMFQTELVWSIYDDNTYNNISNPLLWGSHPADETYKKYVYETLGNGSVTDVRSANWWTWAATTPSWFYMSKYQRNLVGSSTGTVDQTKWDMIVPMIRLTEMYYIAAEACLDTDITESLRLINEVREAHMITKLDDSHLASPSALMEQIVAEYQKDTWGEGKLFYLYKRLYRNIVTLTENIPASRAIYELPVPKEELEFGAN